MLKKPPQTKNSSSQSDSSADGLIVHNMPRITKSGPLGIIKKTGSGGFSLNDSAKSGKSKVKTTGLLIIGGGLILILALAYLSYHFIVKPVAQPTTSAVVAQPAATETATTTTVAATTTNNITTSSPVAPQISNELTVSSTILQLEPGVSPKATSLLVNPQATSSVATNTGVMATSSETVGGTSSKLPPLADTDQDGINDLEEQAFGTSATSSDTNNNGYPDLTEIKNNYNPIGTGHLASDTALATFINSKLGYYILYLKNWPEAAVNNGDTVVFTAPDDSLIQISVQDNSRHVAISDWYQNLFPGTDSSQLTQKSTATWDGVGPTGGTNFYLTDKSKQRIFVVSYIPAVSGHLVYPNVFRMMINSLTIGK